MLGLGGAFRRFYQKINYNWHLPFTLSVTVKQPPTFLCIYNSYMTYYSKALLTLDLVQKACRVCTEIRMEKYSINFDGNPRRGLYAVDFEIGDGENVTWSTQILHRNHISKHKDFFPCIRGGFFPMCDHPIQLYSIHKVIYYHSYLYLSQLGGGDKLTAAHGMMTLMPPLDKVSIIRATTSKIRLLIMLQGSRSLFLLKGNMSGCSCCSKH